jgi:two-component system sensor histidine kinase YesM
LPFKTAKLILQPIIENAFNHGLKDKLRNGVVKLSILEEKNQIVLSIEDNGENLDSEKLGKLQEELNSSGNITETTGLVNVHRRLQIKFGKDSGLFVSRGGIGGLKVDIRIKTVEGDKDVQTADR